MAHDVSVPVIQLFCDDIKCFPTGWDLEPKLKALAAQICEPLLTTAQGKPIQVNVPAAEPPSNWRSQ